MKLLRRDFLKGLVTVPFWGYFATGFKGNVDKEISRKSIDYYRRLKINKLEAPYEKLTPIYFFGQEEKKFSPCITIVYNKRLLRDKSVN